MKEILFVAFSRCEPDNCLCTDNSDEIIIYDDQISARSCIYKADKGGLKRPHFTIYNPNKKEVSILAVDNCILLAEDGEKCDFACFTNAAFCFVELKRGLGKNKATKRKKKEEAMSQLKATINIFRSNADLKNALSKLYLIACSCVGYSAASPAAPASDLNLRLSFLKNYEVHLKQGDNITFN